VTYDPSGDYRYPRSRVEPDLRGGGLAQRSWPFAILMRRRMWDRGVRTILETQDFIAAPMLQPPPEGRYRAQPTLLVKAASGGNSGTKPLTVQGDITISMPLPLVCRPRWKSACLTALTILANPTPGPAVLMTCRSAKAVSVSIPDIQPLSVERSQSPPRRLRPSSFDHTHVFPRPTSETAQPKGSRSFRFGTCWVTTN